MLPKRLKRNRPATSLHKVNNIIRLLFSSNSKTANSLSLSRFLFFKFWIIINRDQHIGRCKTAPMILMSWIRILMAIRRNLRQYSWNTVWLPSKGLSNLKCWRSAMSLGKISSKSVNNPSTISKRKVLRLSQQPLKNFSWSHQGCLLRKNHKECLMGNQFRVWCSNL